MREYILTCDVCENVEFNTPNIKQHKKTNSLVLVNYVIIWSLTLLTENNSRVYFTVENISGFGMLPLSEL